MYLARDLELGVLRAVKELPLANKEKPNCYVFWITRHCQR